MYKGYKEVLVNNAEYFGWTKENVVPLKSGVNCQIRILNEREREREQLV